MVNRFGKLSSHKSDGDLDYCTVLITTNQGTKQRSGHPQSNVITYSSIHLWTQGLRVDEDDDILLSHSKKCQEKDKETIDYLVEKRIEHQQHSLQIQNRIKLC